MLINVFGKWVNPANITDIANIKSRTRDGGETHLPDCHIYFIGMGESQPLWIEDKTADEVAAEINKQIKGGE